MQDTRHPCKLRSLKAWDSCGISGQPRLGLAAFSHYVGPAQAHRQPCQRPRGVIPSLGQKEHSSCIRPVAMPGRFRLDDRVACVRNNNAMGQRHAGKISKVRRTVRIAPGVLVDLRTGHRRHAGPQLEPQQRLRRVPLLLSRRGDVRRLEAQRHVVLLHKVRRRRGGAQGGPGADLPEQIMLVASTATRSPAASTPAIGDSSDTTDTLLFSPP